MTRTEEVDLTPAYDAATRALAQHSDKYDTIRDIAVTVIDAAAAAIGRCERKAERKSAAARDLDFIHRNRDSLIRALAGQARTEAADGTAAEKGFYSAELIRAADWLETLLVHKGT